MRAEGWARWAAALRKAVACLEGGTPVEGDPRAEVVRRQEYSAEFLAHLMQALED